LCAVAVWISDDDDGSHCGADDADVVVVLITWETDDEEEKGDTDVDDDNKTAEGIADKTGNEDDGKNKKDNDCDGVTSCLGGWSSSCGWILVPMSSNFKLTSFICA
jgi:hypothetical protein